MVRQEAYLLTLNNSIDLLILGKNDTWFIKILHVRRALADWPGVQVRSLALRFFIVLQNRSNHGSSARQKCCRPWESGFFRAKPRAYSEQSDSYGAPRFRENGLLPLR